MQFGSQPPPPRRRRWWWLVLVAVVALVLAWLFGVFSPNPEVAGLPQTAATSDGLEGSGGDDPGVVQPGAVATGPEIAFGQPSRTTDSPGSLDLAGSDRIPDAVRRLRATGTGPCRVQTGAQDGPSSAAGTGWCRARSAVRNWAVRLPDG